MHFTNLNSSANLEWGLRVQDTGLFNVFHCIHLNFLPFLPLWTAVDCCPLIPLLILGYDCVTARRTRDPLSLKSPKSMRSVRSQWPSRWARAERACTPVHRIKNLYENQVAELLTIKSLTWKKSTKEYINNCLFKAFKRNMVFHFLRKGKSENQKTNTIHVKILFINGSILCAIWAGICILMVSYCDSMCAGYLGGYAPRQALESMFI